MKQLACALVLSLVLGFPVVPRFLDSRTALRQKSPINSQEVAQPTNCEGNIAMLEAANHAAGEEDLIIMIARLGQSEMNQSLNQRRLHNARFYLANYLGVRAAQTIVIAEGESIKGYGRVELYVHGKLYNTLALNRNADLIVGSCEPEQLDDPRQRDLRMKLYPWRDRKRRS